MTSRFHEKLTDRVKTDARFTYFAEFQTLQTKLADLILDDSL